MAAQEAPAARLDQKMLWPRERRWPLNLITKRYWPRKNRRSYRAPTGSVSRAGRIARRQLPYRAPVVSRADSFRSAAGLLPSESLVALPSSCARRSHWNSALSASSTLVAYTVLTVPQASESRRPKCDRITPPHLLSWPCCLSDLLSSI